MKKSIQILICLLFFFGKMLAASPPAWTVNATSFSYSENVVAQLSDGGVAQNGAANLVGAFVGNELRGVGSPIFPGGGTAFYFFTMYSNQVAGETVTFKMYLAATDEVKTVAEITVFQHNHLLGDYLNPFLLHTATGPTDEPPSLAPIPGQTTLVGIPFSGIDLPSFFSSPDGDAVTFSAVTGPNLTASISPTNQLTVSPVSPTLTGSELVTVTVTENTAGQLSASRIIVFTRNADYAGPQFFANPSQTRPSGQAFSNFNLTNYLTFGGTCLDFGVEMIPFSGSDAAPSWAAPVGGAGSMLLTARADFGHLQPLPGTGHLLSAWVGNTFAGVASPTLVGDENLYFLLVNNVGSGVISFKFYDAVRQKEYAVSSAIPFSAGTSQGSVDQPVVVQLAPLTPQLLDGGMVHITIHDPSWMGFVDAIFTAKDCSFPAQKQASQAARFRVGDYCTTCGGTTFSLSNASACQSNGTGQGGDDFFTADVSLAFNCPPSVGYVLLKQGNFTRAIVSKEMLDSPTAHVFHNVQLPANGGPIVLSVEFDGCAKVSPSLGTAPAACSLSGVLSGNKTICVGSTAWLTLAITGGVGPFTVILTDGTTNFTFNGVQAGQPLPVTPNETKGFWLVSLKDAGNFFASSVSGTASVVVSTLTVGGSVGSAQTICSGSAPATLNLTGQNGSVLKWQSSPDGSSWTNISNTTASFLPAAMTSNKQFRAVVKSGVCPEMNSTAVLISVDAPTAGGTVTPSQTICNGTAPYTIFLQNQVGVVVKWQNSTDGGGSWNDFSSTATSHSPGVLTTTTQFRAVLQSGVCTAIHSTAATITITPLPTVTMTTVAPVCVNGATVSLTGSPSGGTFSGVGVSGNSFNPAAAGVGSHVITYTATASGCTNSTVQTIVVNALPTVSLANFAVVCANTPAFALTGGSPGGGTYSGPGVVAGVFNPTTAGVGTKTITYSYTDGNGCTVSTSKTIVVNSLPTSTLADQPTVCTTAPAFSLAGGLPAGGTYSGNSVSGGNFSAVAAGAGVHVITYTVTNANGCTATSTKNLTVSGSCSTSCTIVTCPPARNVNMTAACKIVIPNLLPEVILGGDCASPAVKTQIPAAGLLVAATHNTVINVAISVVDAAGNAGAPACSVALTPKDVSGPVITNCSPAAINASMTSLCKISIPNIAAMTTATDCSTGTLTKTQVPAANTQIPAVHNQLFTVVVTVTDAAGNSTTCTRTVQAKDQAKPVISTCAPADTVPLGVGCILTFPNKTGQLVLATDCSMPLGKTQSPAAASTVVTTPGATHTMTFTVIDAAGNSKTCTTIITAGPTCPTMLLGGDQNVVEAVKSPNLFEKTGLLTEKPHDLQTMPNPFSEELAIEFEVETAGNTRLVLMDLTGQFQFFSTENGLEKGRQKVVWNTEDLPGGAYFVGLKTEASGWVWRKVMLVR